MKKMNNKGFSLVELIVVVLIMAIIAVALAPQVMKWVENSRVSTDCTNYESMTENLQLALADKDVYKAISGKENVVIYMNIGEGGADFADAAGAVSDPGTTTDTKPTAVINDEDDFIAAVNYGLTKIDGSWPKIAKKASADPVEGDAYYSIKITSGKQANVEKSSAYNPDRLKNGTDLS